MNKARVVLMTVLGATLFSSCSAQETVAPREFRFFTPLTKVERKPVAQQPQTNTYEKDLRARDVLIDSLRGQINNLRDAAGKLEKMIVAENPILLEKGKNVVLQGVTFQLVTATLSAQSEPVLRRAVAALLAHPDIKVEIACYTEDMGDAQASEILSRRRAQTVLDWLVASGIEGKRVTAVGMGMRDPIGPNTTTEGRTTNRRIELHVKN